VVTSASFRWVLPVLHRRGRKNVPFSGRRPAVPTITIQDQTTTGKTTGELTLDVLTERLTVRELIRSRVYQEVQDFNH
jgi:hypothetical protein